MPSSRVIINSMTKIITKHYQIWERFPEEESSQLVKQHIYWVPGVYKLFMIGVAEWTETKKKKKEEEEENRNTVDEAGCGEYRGDRVINLQ